MANATRRKSGNPATERADLALCARGLAETRTKAQELIREGRVRADGRLVTKPSATIAGAAEVLIEAGRDFVSRGGRKLDAALDELGLGLEGLAVVDVGASTGGFTDSALRRGARRVYAVDVGSGQLDLRLARDPRVVVRDATNARSLAAADFPEPIDLVLVDASFISLDKLAPALGKIVRSGGSLVALVKPEFEVGREAARRTRGVVRDQGLRERGIDHARAAVRAAGFEILAECDSTVPGKKGNVERFVLAVKK